MVTSVGGCVLVFGGLFAFGCAVYMVVLGWLFGLGFWWLVVWIVAVGFAYFVGFMVSGILWCGWFVDCLLLVLL